MKDTGTLTIKIVSKELDEVKSLAEDVARLCHMIPEERHMEAKEITDKLESTVNKWLDNLSCS